MIAPIRIGFSDSSGNCATSTTIKNNIWDIKFGQDFLAFCYGNGATALSNVNSAFQVLFEIIIQYLGKLGGSNVTYSSDFVNINTSLTKSGVLSIYYSKIGEQNNNQF